jgi:hypothetical protein
MRNSLRGKPISETYHKLIQVVDGVFYDGAGNPIVVGPTGPRGFQGTSGFQGIQGPQGWQGSTGTQGFQGPSGFGFQGIQGPQGRQGFIGLQGVPGDSGPVGPQGGGGADGANSVRWAYGEESKVGEFRADPPFYATANKLFINNRSIDSVDMESWFGTLYAWVSLYPGRAILSINDVNDRSSLGAYYVSSVSISAFIEIDVVSIFGTGDMFEKGDKCSISWVLLGEPGPTGEIGPAGENGSPGPQGAQGVAGPLLNIVSTSPGATAPTVVYDFTQGSIFYHGTASNNYTANFINVPTTNNRTVTVTIMIAQGSIGYSPIAVRIEGTPQSIKWMGGTYSVSTNKLDVVGFTFLRTGNAWTQVLGQISSFS